MEPTMDQGLQIINPIGNTAFHADQEVTRAGNLIHCDLKTNQNLKLRE